MRLSELLVILVAACLVILFLTVTLLGGGGFSKPEEKKHAAALNMQVQATLIETFNQAHEFTIQPQLHQWLKAINQKGIEQQRKRKLIRYRKKMLRKMVNESKQDLNIPGFIPD